MTPRFGIVEGMLLLFAAILAVAAWAAWASGLPNWWAGLAACGALACTLLAAVPWFPRRQRYLRGERE